MRFLAFVLSLLVVASPCWAGASRSYVSSNSDFMDLGSNTDIDGITSGTLVFWLRLKSQPGTTTWGIFCKDASGTNVGDFNISFGFVSTDNKLNWFITNHTVGADLVTSDNAFNANQWYGIAVLWGSSEMHMLVDGVVQTDTGTVNDGMANAAATAFLGKLRGSLWFANIYLAHMQLFNRKLSDIEAKESLLHPGSVISGMIRFYTQMDSSSTVEKDLTGIFDATVSGPDEEFTTGPPVFIGNMPL